MTGGDSEDDRTAPGALALVQELLNAPGGDPSPEELAVAEAVREAGAAGEAQARIAARFAVSQQLVSAVLRGKRLSPNAPTLGSPESAERWLRSRGWEVPGGLSASDHGRMLELRGALHSLAFANGGGARAVDGLETLTRLARNAPLVVAFEASGATLQPAGSGVEAFVAKIVATVYDAMRDGTWPRLKACPADRCGHVFYDGSRNRTSTWCSMAICGNRAKVRSYQERRRRH